MLLQKSLAIHFHFSIVFFFLPFTLYILPYYLSLVKNCIHAKQNYLCSISVILLQTF